MLNLTEREYMAAQRELTDEIKTYESMIRCLNEKIDRTMREKKSLADRWHRDRATSCLNGEVSHVA